MAYLKMKAINYGRGAAKPRGGHILLKSEVSPAGTRHEPIVVGMELRKGEVYCVIMRFHRCRQAKCASQNTS
jgi:hypothetical protein